MNDSVSELEDYIGKTGLLSVTMGQGRATKQPVSIQVPVVVVDVKRAWGNLRFQVRAHDKRKELGKAWVDATRVILDDQRA